MDKVYRGVDQKVPDPKTTSPPSKLRSSKSRNLKARNKKRQVIITMSHAEEWRMETDQFWGSLVVQVTDDGSLAPLDHRTMVTVTHGATVGGLDMYWMLQWLEWIFPSKTHVEMQLPTQWYWKVGRFMGDQITRVPSTKFGACKMVLFLSRLPSIMG